MAQSTAVYLHLHVVAVAYSSELREEGVKQRSFISQRGSRCDLKVILNRLERASRLDRAIAVCAASIWRDHL